MTKIVAAALNTRHTHSALALAYIKAYWEKDPGRIPIDICEFDLNQTNEGIIAELILHKPDILAFSVYIWSLLRTIDIAGAIKAALPDTIIIFGGPEVSYNSEWLMQRHECIDFIVRGEGEVTFAELLQKLIAGYPAADVKGITWRDSSAIIINDDRELIKDLDSIPSPFQAGFYKKRHSFTYYEASRGCPSRCSYCLSSVLGHLRYFSIERVEADLDWFFKSDYRQVRFADRTFNHDHARARRIIGYVKTHNTRNINVHFEIQADFLSEDIIDLLSDAPEGMFHLEIGVQSTNPAALRAVNRRFDLATLRDRVQKLKQRTKCHLHLDLLGALPEDSFADFCKSLDDVWQLQADSIQISLVKVLRGTPLENTLQRNEIAAMPTPPYTVLRTKWLSQAEAIHIQDIGKLVEGIYNCRRFTHSLNFIVNRLYAGCASQLFISLADYWRSNDLAFYNFSPENIARQLQKFTTDTCNDNQETKMLPSLLEHELRLTQKVPVSSNPAFTPQFASIVRRTGFRLQPGYRVLWYEYDPAALISDNQKQRVPRSPAPVVYRFEPDLSATPEVDVIRPGLAASFIMAAVQVRADECCWAATWEKIWPDIPLPDFAQTLEKLVESGLLYVSADTQKSTRQQEEH